MTAPAVIYKIVTKSQWEEAQTSGVFKGAPVDLADGYIHFSTAGQVVETASKHFAGQDGLLLLTVDAAAFGEALIYEPSRGGQLFPHLYAPMTLAAVRAIDELPIGADGRHQFPTSVEAVGRSGGPTIR